MLWHLRWDRKNSLIVPHFVDNIAFGLHESLLKFCQRRSSDSADQTIDSSINPLILTTISPSISSIHSPQNWLDDLPPIPEKPPALSLVLASITLHDASASEGKSDVVIPITILFQNDHISWSALIHTDSPVFLLSEKLT